LEVSATLIEPAIRLIPKKRGGITRRRFRRGRGASVLERKKMRETEEVGDYLAPGIEEAAMVATKKEQKRKNHPAVSGKGLGMQTACHALNEGTRS